MEMLFTSKQLPFSFRDDVKLITCNYKNALIDCVQPIRDCMSADMKMEQDEEMENVTRILGKQIRNANCIRKLITTVVYL